MEKYYPIWNERQVSTHIYIWPFKVIERIELVVYHLMLPPQMARIHNVFHVSLLQKVEVEHEFCHKCQ